MRKRNVHVQFWLDKKEAEDFNKKVKRSGLSREAYLRHLVNEMCIRDRYCGVHYQQRHSGQGKLQRPKVPGTALSLIHIFSYAG